MVALQLRLGMRGPSLVVVLHLPKRSQLAHG
jgi:hypothetical protein